MKKKYFNCNWWIRWTYNASNCFYNLLNKKFRSFISSDLRGLNYLDRKNYNPKVVKTPQIFNSYLLLPFKIILVLYLIIVSIIFLRKSKIDIVFSTGGYAPIPLCIASLILKKNYLFMNLIMLLENQTNFFTLLSQNFLSFIQN